MNMCYNKTMEKIKFNSGVYEIVNTVNGKRYIGSSVNLSRRRSAHYADLEGSRHGNAHLQSAFDKYGIDNFEFRTLLLCDPENCLMYEQMCIDALKPEYNILPTAGNRLGSAASDEARRKNSEAHKGIRPSEETRAKLSEASKGHVVSEETKRKISEAKKLRWTEQKASSEVVYA